MALAELTTPTTCSPRYATPRNPDRPTHGGKVSLIAEALGTPFMPWQREVADVALEVDPATGRLAYRTVIVSVPRQQGKTTLLLPLWLQRAVTWAGQHIAWTMQDGTAARKKWEDEHLPVIEGSPLMRAVRKVRKTNGREAVLFKNGSMQSLMATTVSSGHGQVVDLGIVDEAFAQTDDRLEQSMRPAMKTRNRDGMAGPQMWLVSTMGTTSGSEWFHGWCDAGREAVLSGGPSPVAYFEWSAPEDCDPADPAVWWSCMPALGYTISEDTVRTDYQQALMRVDGLAGFRRESLNQRTATKGDPVIPLVVWDACADPAAPRPSGPLVWAVDVSPDQASAAIAVCGRRRDGLPQVEVVDHRPGAQWVEEKAAELRRRHGGKWRVDRHGPAASLRLSFADDVQGPDAVAACVSLEKAAREGLFRHVDRTGDLRLALDGATKSQVGDAWRWSRKNSEADISPLVAAGLALHPVMCRPSVDPLKAIY